MPSPLRPRLFGLLLLVAGLTVPAQAMRLNEILPENEGGLRDADGSSPGWIELFNESATAVNLQNWRLTDDPALPAKWVFPSVSVPAGGYLIVFASGKNRTGTELHANFQLDPDGDYLALSRPDGVVEADFAPGYPKLRRNISYSKGTNPGGDYYAVPTPRAVNGTAYPGYTADTVFSVDRGFYATAFTTELTCATPGAVIRYTINGAAPTATTGTVAGGPVSITGTTVLRAAAFVPGWIPSNVDTQSYVFNAQTPTQPANPAGWPADWGYNAQVDTNDGALSGIVPANYGMDPRVVNNTVPGFGMAEALAQIPSLSLALAPADFLGTAGIYQNPTTRGIAWEKACSVELMDPAGLEKGFHETAQVEMHGNSSRTPWRMQKHSFRVTFSSGFGATKLRYRLFPGNGVNEYNKFVLRGCFTDSWGLVSWTDTRYRPDDSVYFRDIFMRRSHTAMGAVPMESRFVHLYLNGLYWGIYNLTERFDEEHLAAHRGGLPTDYEVVSDFVDPDPSATSRWKTLFTLIASAGSLVSQANYERILGYVDVADFADYYLLHIYGDAEDWPHHNGYAWRRKTGPDLRYRWNTWDQEISFDNHAIDRLGAAAPNTATDRTPGRLYQRLWENPEFRLLMADRAHKMLNNNGPLNLANSQARWQAAASEIDKAIVAESARWGDTAEETPYGNAVPTGRYFTREAHWLPTVNMVRDTWLPSLHNQTNSYATLRKLAARSLYPSPTPPVLSQHGGLFAGSLSLGVTATTGHSIYYTTDGTDPRQAWTGNPLGTLYTGSIPLARTTTVIARARSGLTWSARTEALFIQGTAAAADNTVISELNYHPLPPANAAEAALTIDKNDFEFVEIANISPDLAIDLTGIRFTAGINSTPLATGILRPGERGVFVRNQAAFTERYGTLVPVPRILGTFTGSLDNSGELLTLTAVDDSPIKSFLYSDSAPWPVTPDGLGPTLVLVGANTNPDHAQSVNWHASTASGGSPGTLPYAQWAATLALPSPSGDADGDGLVNLLEYALGTNPTAPDGSPSTVTIRPDGAILYSQRHRLGDDISLTPQLSTALGGSTAPAGWSGTSLTFESQLLHGDGTATTTWRAPNPGPGQPRQFFRVLVGLFQPLPAR